MDDQATDVGSTPVPGALHEHALQSPMHVGISLHKLDGGIAGAKIRPPDAVAESRVTASRSAS